MYVCKKEIRILEEIGEKVYRLQIRMVCLTKFIVESILQKRKRESFYLGRRTLFVK